MAAPPTTGRPEPAGTWRGTTVKVAATWILLPLFFLASGGSFAWWQAWVYCALILLPMTVFLMHMTKRDPQFLARRLKVREKRGTQRRVQAWGSACLVGTLVVSGLDHRFGRSHPALAFVIVAMAIALIGYLAVLRVFLENRWAGRTVETSAEQRVVTTGPYAIVRHPMYAGTIVLYLATPIALGSVWALLPALALIPILVARIRNEEDLLVRELSGYEEYRRKVRYRLVPSIW